MPRTSRTDLVRRIEDYFRDVDSFDTAAILSHLTYDCVVEVVNHGVVHQGTAAIRASYDRRAQVVQRSWHGDFIHTIDEDAQRVATRLTVRRIDADGTGVEAHNLTLFQFDGSKIRRISIWMSGANTLAG